MIDINYKIEKIIINKLYILDRKIMVFLTN